MSDFIQSANALVSRVAKWVGAIPKSTGITATAYHPLTGVIDVSTDPTGIILVGDFVGVNTLKGFAVVTAFTSSTSMGNTAAGTTAQSYQLGINHKF